MPPTVLSSFPWAVSLLAKPKKRLPLNLGRRFFILRSDLIVQVLDGVVGFTRGEALGV